MSEFPIESSAQLAAAGQIVQKARNMAKMENAKAADLNTSVMTVSSRYRHENQNSIYYLRPNSTDVFFLDFKLKGFVKEQLKWQRGRGVIPAQISTTQTTDASIYVVGGTRTAT